MNSVYIAGRELRSLFCSPFAWILIAAFLGILGWLFQAQISVFERLAPNLVGVSGAPGITAIVVAPVLKSAALLLLMTTPLVTMRLLSAEHRDGTLALLLSAPLTMTELVLGKFLAVMVFFCVILVAVALLPLSLLAGAQLDPGLAGAGFLGLFLLACAFAAAGLFMSSLTANPAAAAAATLGLLLGLWLVDWAGASATDHALGQVLAYLSFTGHMDGFLRGLFTTRDVVFYLLVTAGFLTFTVRRLDSLRLVH